MIYNNNNNIKLMIYNSFKDISIYYDKELMILYAYKSDQMIYRVHLNIYDNFNVIQQKAEMLYTNIKNKPILVY